MTDDTGDRAPDRADAAAAAMPTTPVTTPARIVTWVEASDDDDGELAGHGDQMVVGAACGVIAIAGLQGCDVVAR